MILFRTDASPSIGSGHVMRCLTLASALRERAEDCAFACREQAGDLCELIEQGGFPCHRLAGRDDAEETAAIVATSLRPAWLVVDHYGLDFKWERRVRPLADRLMVIDDLDDRRHECDFFLDQNLGAGPASRYEGRVPPECGMLLGAEFALLQPAYSELHTRVPVREGEIRRILVTFGGADQQDCTGRTVAAVLDLGRAQLEIDVVVSESFPHHVALAALARGGTVRIHRQVPTLAPLMVQADLAIGAAGTTSWERLCLGLPSLVITLAENQRANAEALQRLGLAEWLGDQEVVDRAAITDAMRRLMDGGLDSAWSARCLRMVDGRGAGRVAAAMLLGAETPLVARLAVPGDEARLLDWANDPATRRNAFTPDPIPAEAHRRWFRARLRDVEDCRLYIVETDDGLALGSVRFQRSGNGWELHYSLAAPFRGRGIGRRMLETALAALDVSVGDRVVFGRVKPSNLASRRVFERLGFSLAPIRDDSDAVLYERRAGAAP